MELKEVVSFFTGQVADPKLPEPIHDVRLTARTVGRLCPAEARASYCDWAGATSVIARQESVRCAANVARADGYFHLRPKRPLPGDGVDQRRRRPNRPWTLQGL